MKGVGSTAPRAATISTMRAALLLAIVIAGARGMGPAASPPAVSETQGASRARAGGAGRSRGCQRGVGMVVFWCALLGEMSVRSG